MNQRPYSTTRRRVRVHHKYPLQTYRDLDLELGYCRDISIAEMVMGLREIPGERYRASPHAPGNFRRRDDSGPF